MSSLSVGKNKSDIRMKGMGVDICERLPEGGQNLGIS
jgi:hypothetical protein